MEDQPQNEEKTGSEEQPEIEQEPNMTESAQGGEAAVQQKPKQLPGAIPAPIPLTASSARTWAMLAHLSMLLNLFTGFLGPIVALIIYLVFKDRSRYVAYQSMQSFVFQLVFFVGAGAIAAILWVITLPLMLIIIGCCLAPLAILVSIIPFAAVIYGIVGAIQTGQGEDFRYWLVGDWVMPREGSPGPI